ncbi:MAG: hypothetical protein CME61_08240 [Halobacteriovoraceae bacterium]|nr:hypothetical protein [Halobacteriovoraceae bacterium]
MGAPPCGVSNGFSKPLRRPLVDRRPAVTYISGEDMPSPRPPRPIFAAFTGNSQTLPLEIKDQLPDIGQD